MFWAKKSYFRRIFDLRHFYDPDDNLYHPERKSPANRLKTAKSVMEQKKPPQTGRQQAENLLLRIRIGRLVQRYINRPHFATGPVLWFYYCSTLPKQR